MTSYLATATKQDGALCHGFVKKLFMVVFFCISFLLLLFFTVYYTHQSFNNAHLLL